VGVEMARAAVVWSESDGFKLTPLREQGENIISRSPDAAVVLTDPTISRSPHASVRISGTGFVFQHLREGVTPSRVNDVVVTNPVALSDGDVLQVGEMRLAFLDLAAGDKRAAYIQCSNPSCRRRNSIDRTDCWFCGENLANAESTVYQVTKVVCRVVTSESDRYDLFNGDSLALGDAGKVTSSHGPASGGDPTALEVDESSVRLRIQPGTSGIRFNGNPPEDGTRVQTGDRLAINDSEFVFIVR